MKSQLLLAKNRGLLVRIHLSTGDKVVCKIRFQSQTHIHVVPEDRLDENPLERRLPKDVIKIDNIVYLEFL